MANLLQNTLILQEEHHIPMRMDLTMSKLLEYYRSYVNTLESLEGERTLQQVIHDLEEKEREQIEMFK